MPTQTTAQAGESSEATIVFDGKTFTVAFSQTAGQCRVKGVCPVQCVPVGPSHCLVGPRRSVGVRPVYEVVGVGITFKKFCVAIEQ